MKGLKNPPEPVCIASAVRTPIGSLNGCLSSLKAHELGSYVIADAVKRAGIEGHLVDEVIMGQVHTAGQGQNPARQASLLSGIPQEVPAWGVNMLCGSGLKAVVLGCQAITSGDLHIVVAGGQESMSQAPHCLHLRSGTKMGDVSVVDSMLKDGLVDAFLSCHMGITAENVAQEYQVSREEQDNYAHRSQIKTENAVNMGHFEKEIVGVSVGKKGASKLVYADEFPRPGTTLEGLNRLQPCFLTTGDGTVTAGNASGINDGAAALVLMSSERATQGSFPVLAKVISWAQAGVAPRIMGMGPAPAIRRALEKAGWTIQDVDLFELNEAFSAQAIAVTKELDIDPSKVNINGGAIALGHPIGASGARILVTLLHALHRTGGKKGVAALCIGGGMGIALCVQVD